MTNGNLSLMPSPYLQKGSKSLQHLDLISSGSEDPALPAALSLSCTTLLARTRHLVTHNLPTPPELRRQRTLEQGREFQPRHHRHGGRMVRGGGCPRSCRLCSVTCGFHRLDAAAAPSPEVTSRNISRHCPLCPGDRITPS